MILGDVFECLQMRLCITVPKRMIGDEIETTLEKRAEMSVVGHAASMERRRAFGKERGLAVVRAILPAKAAFDSGKIARATQSFGGAGLMGGLLAADDAFGLRRSFVGVCLETFVPASNEQLAEVFAAEAEVFRLMRCRDDEVHTSCLIANLNAKRGRNIEPAVSIHAHRIGFYWVSKPVRILGEIKRLSILEQWRFITELHTIDPSVVACDIEQTLIRREADQTTRRNQNIRLKFLTVKVVVTPVHIDPADQGIIASCEIQSA